MRRMETPPTYAPPRKKSNTGLIIGLILGGIAICCIGGVALLFFGGAWLVKKAIPIAECQMNYEVVKDSMTAYADAHDGALPSADKWQDELAPYAEKAVAAYGKKEDNPFKVLDPHGEWGCVTDDVKTGMAFNDKYSGKKLSEARMDDGVVIFETEATGRNLHEMYVEKDKKTSPKFMNQPRGWFTIHGASGVRAGSKTSFNVKYED